MSLLSDCVHVASVPAQMASAHRLTFVVQWVQCDSVADSLCLL